MLQVSSYFNWRHFDFLFYIFDYIFANCTFWMKFHSTCFVSFKNKLDFNKDFENIALILVGNKWHFFFYTFVLFFNLVIFTFFINGFLLSKIVFWICQIMFYQYIGKMKFKKNSNIFQKDVKRRFQKSSSIFDREKY